jgi:hypothetical protein
MCPCKTYLDGRRPHRRTCAARWPAAPGPRLDWAAVAEQSLTGRRAAGPAARLTARPGQRRPA